MQDSRAAIASLMQKGKSDFIPLYDSPWGDTVQQWREQGYPAEGTPGSDPTSHFGFDMVGCGGWIDWLAKRNANETLEETDDWKITRNGNGAVFKYWKHKSGTPEHIEFHMDCRKVWEEEYRPHLLEDVRPRLGNLDEKRKVFEAQAKTDRWTFYGNMFNWEFLRASLGDENMFVAMIEDPDWLHDFNRVYTDLLKKCYAILFDEVGVPDGFWIYEDLGYRDRLFCSPEILRDLFFPYYTEFVEFLHGYGLPVVLHSCGFQKPMIPLAIEAGFDALNPMEVKAGNDIFAYAEKYGDKLCFVGGLDARILESGDRDTIRKGVTGLVNGMRDRGTRFIFGSDHSLSTRIRYEDFLYALDVYRELRVN